MIDFLQRFHAEALDRNTYAFIGAALTLYVGALLIWWGKIQ